MDNHNLRPVKTGVLIRCAVAESRTAELHIPEFYQEPEPEGLVLAVGSDVHEVEIGDYVRYERYHEKWVHVMGEKLAIVDEDKIWGVMEQGLQVEELNY